MHNVRLQWIAVMQRTAVTLRSIHVHVCDGFLGNEILVVWSLIFDTIFKMCPLYMYM